MQLTFYGHSSFGIRCQNGLLIVTDPYDPEKSGFKPYPDAADIVIKSSSNDDFHDNDALVPKRENAAVVDANEVALDSGQHETHGIVFRAIEAMENLDHPHREPDQNAMYRFVVDNIEIGHMGDMGNEFSDEQLAFFEGVDILFAHAGGYPVISLDEMRRVVDHVAPKLVVPMHFRTLCYKPQDMEFITAFLDRFDDDDVDFACASTVELKQGELPDKTRALVLDYL